MSKSRIRLKSKLRTPKNLIIEYYIALSGKNGNSPEYECLGMRR